MIHSSLQLYMGLNEHNFLRACHEPNFFGSRAELEPETYELQPRFYILSRAELSRAEIEPKFEARAAL